jgi:hypothetical protein
MFVVSVVLFVSVVDCRSRKMLPRSPTLRAEKRGAENGAPEFRGNPDLTKD